MRSNKSILLKKIYFDMIRLVKNKKCNGAYKLNRESGEKPLQPPLL